MVAVLFADEHSVYKQFPECDVYDLARDATTWPGDSPVIAHPPCRLWSRLHYFSTAPASEKLLAAWAVGMVNRWGGVLEHPASSQLFSTLGLPRPGGVLPNGAYTIGLPQYWFGHVCLKPTWLYISGCPPANLPPVPYALGVPPAVISSSTRRVRTNGQRHASKRERIATPPRLAQWLIAVAKSCKPQEES